MRDDQHAHRREAYGVRGSSTSRSDSLGQSSMSRGEGTRMASHRAFTAGATTTPAAQSPGTRASARDTTPASGGRSLTRAALYARVSTAKHEREATVASQVDLLQQPSRAAVCGAPRAGQLGESPLWLHLHPEDAHHSAACGDQ